MTNHAVDSFLEDLLKVGVKRIARVGGRSKEKWIKEYLISELSGKKKSKDSDRKRISRDRWAAKRSCLTT
jgi:hypothetical protein